MPIENETRNDGPDADIASFQQACSEFWPNVTKIVCTKMKPRNPIELRSGTVVHMTNAEGKPINDSKGIIDRYASIAKSDAERHGPCDYRIAVWGHREIPTSKRKVIAPPEELHAVRFRLGEGGDDDGKGDAGLIREAAALVKANASATHDLTLGMNNVAGGYEKLLGLTTGMLSAQAAVIQANDDRETKHAGIHLEVKKLEFDFKVKEHEWHREDSKEQREHAEIEEERKHELRIREKRNDMFSKMGEKMMDNPEAMRSVAYVIRSVGDLIQAGASLLKKSQQAAGFAEESGTEASGSSTGLGPRLHTIFAKLLPEGRIAIEAALTTDVWDRLQAAATKTNDDEVRAILAPIQDLWHPQDHIVHGDDGKPDALKSKTWTDAEKAKAKAVKDMALNATAKILEHHMPDFVRILEDAGLKLR